MRWSGSTRVLVVSVMMVSAALLACKKKKATTESVGIAPPTPTPTPTLEPLPATPTQTFKLNEAAKLDGITVTVEEFRDCRLDNFYSRRALQKKKEKLVGANVVFEGNAPKDHSVSYTAFRVNDSEGLTFRATTRSGSNCSPTLKSGRVASGEKSRGWVLFEVPEKSSGFKLVLTNRRPYRSGTPSGEQEQKVTFSPGM